MLGRLPTYGAVPGKDDTSALQTWLNTNSTASVRVFTINTPLTAGFLRNYDLLILQALEDREGGDYWEYTADEISNLQKWVSAGGGVIGLTGYGAKATEVKPINNLLSFTGLSYNMDDVITNCPNGCCYCVGNSVPITGWNDRHPIANRVRAVGGFHGRSINVPAGGETVVSQGTTVLGATVKVGKGRVFVFADEWVTYTSQWTGEGITQDCRHIQNDSCSGVTAANLYQVPLFWYNAIRWVSGDRPCFQIKK
jgi:hypothetical protein